MNEYDLIQRAAGFGLTLDAFRHRHHSSTSWERRRPAGSFLCHNYLLADETSALPGPQLENKTYD
ncbi:MAG: hypothetical protein WBN75_08695 [Verrucomicrobiia bacterium]